MLTYIPVNSSMIESYAIDGQDLVIKYLRGTEYRYCSVGPLIIKDFKSARSKGKFIASHIKDKFMAVQE